MCSRLYTLSAKSVSRVAWSQFTVYLSFSGVVSTFTQKGFWVRQALTTPPYMWTCHKDRIVSLPILTIARVLSALKCYRAYETFFFGGGGSHEWGFGAFNDSPQRFNAVFEYQHIHRTILSWDRQKCLFINASPSYLCCHIIHNYIIHERSTSVIQIHPQTLIDYVHKRVFIADLSRTFIIIIFFYYWTFFFNQPLCAPLWGGGIWWPLITNFHSIHAIHDSQYSHWVIST